mmetsp:Transcript_4373/g.8483  ORF Transcript_4373/g.8483 Transcript_4373/m.8483 type:complete len:250 (+) Transcript_4373:1295-2044(+)
MFRELCVGVSRQGIVVRVLGETTIEQGPGNIVYSVLHTGDGARHDLRVDMVVQIMIQVTFDGQRFIEQFFQMFLFGCVTENHTFATLVNKGPTGLSHHVQHRGDGMVNISSFLPIVRFRGHDDDQGSRGVKFVAEGLGCDEYTYLFLSVQSHHGFIILDGHAIVYKTNSDRDDLPQRGFLERLGHVRKFFVRTIVGHKALRPKSLREGHEINGRQLCLPLAGHKNHDGFGNASVPHDGVVHRLSHGQQP